MLLRWTVQLLRVLRQPPSVAESVHPVLLLVQVPLPHVSLAWTPGDQTSSLQPWLDTVQHEPIQLKVGEACDTGLASKLVQLTGAGVTVMSRPILLSRGCGLCRCRRWCARLARCGMSCGKADAVSWNFCSCQAGQGGSQERFGVPAWQTVWVFKRWEPETDFHNSNYVLCVFSTIAPVE